MKYRFRALPLYNEDSKHRVDTQKGVIYDVVLAQSGMNKNGTYFSERFLKELEERGNERGYIKARFGHPVMCGNSLGSLIGRYKNFRVSGGKLYGDLYLDDIAKDTQVEGRGISMYDYVMRMATSNSEMFGNSIVISADEIEERYIDKAGKECVAGGHVLREFLASDLVDDPAATDSLFHSVGDDLGVLVSEFLDDHPEIFEALDKNPRILRDFFERYEAYSRRKKL